jgi:hypothetical protein
MWLHDCFDKWTNKLLLVVGAWLIALMVVVLQSGALVDFMTAIAGTIVFGLGFPMALGAPLTIFFADALENGLLEALLPWEWLLYSIPA